MSHRENQNSFSSDSCETKRRRRRRRKCKKEKKNFSSNDCDSCDMRRRKKYKKKKKFCTVLTGSQEVPAVNTTGLGSGNLVLSKCRRKLHFKIEVKNLESPLEEPSQGAGFAHFHLGKAGVNGPIVRNITNDACLSEDKKSVIFCGKWTKWDEMPLTKELVKELKKGNIFVNLHTKDHPSGEVRGQVVALKLLKHL